MTGRAEKLLTGPRGRQLCLTLVKELPRGGVPWGWLEHDPDGRPVLPADLEGFRRQLADAVRRVDLAAVEATTEPGVLLSALTSAVDTARYWQPPDEDEVLLADPVLAAELRPVAQAVVRAPASAWWAEPAPVAEQHVVAWQHDQDRDDPARAGDLAAPELTDARPTLQRWREDELAEERRARRDRPADVHANWSGTWWSTPISVGQIVTTRAVPGIAGAGVPAPARLDLVEDHMGWQTARSWPVRVREDARVLEVTGPADWAALVERHPLEVTASRRHDWWRITEWDGTWLIPDWAAVAADVDAVHLTVDGYLSTAGRAIAVVVPALGREARTVLAGWDPDVTWWLTDALTELGGATDWRRPDYQEPWSSQAALPG